MVLKTRLSSCFPIFHIWYQIKVMIIILKLINGFTGFRWLLRRGPFHLDQGKSKKVRKVRETCNGQGEITFSYCGQEKDLSLVITEVSKVFSLYLKFVLC